MAIKQISVFVQNEKGALVDVLETIADANIEIRALSIADTNDFGILRMITNDNKRAALVLAENGYVCSATDVVAACVPDCPGGLAKEIKILSDSGVNVEYLYAFVTKDKGEACVVLRVNDNDSAEATLNTAGIRLISEEEIINM